MLPVTELVWVEGVGVTLAALQQALTLHGTSKLGKTFFFLIFKFFSRF